MALKIATTLGALALAAGLPLTAHAADLTPALQPLAFLVGTWEGAGEVRDTGGQSHGISVISAEADGRVLLRSDRTDLIDKAGKPAGSFHIIMTVYAEAGEVRGDYFDGGGHVIHYGPAAIVASKSVEFTSVASPGAPLFRLRYEADGAEGLKIWFGIEPPGQTAFSPIAIGEVHRKEP